MANQITIGTHVLDQYDSGNNMRSWVDAGHTEAKPEVMIQRRTVPENTADSNAFATKKLKVVMGTEDANGDPLAKKISIETICKVPQGALAADVTKAIALHQAATAHADFTIMVTKSLYYTGT